MDEFMKNILGDDVPEGATPEEIQELFKQRYIPANEHAAALDKEKAARDKAASEAAEMKRKMREGQTEAERKAEEMADQQRHRDEQFETMKRELEIGKLTKKYMGLGWGEELATEQSNAFYDRDMETMLSNEKLFLESQEKAIKARVLKDMPKPPAGSGKDKDPDDPFLMGWK